MKIPTGAEKPTNCLFTKAAMELTRGQLRTMAGELHGGGLENTISRKQVQCLNQ